MRTGGRRIRGSLAVGTMLFTLLSAPLQATTLDEVLARGRLIVLCFPHQASTFIRTDVDKGLGHYEGVDYELMTAFAQFLGVELEIRPVKPAFDALIPELIAGKGDLIASSFSITPERERRVDFSDPYFELRIAAVVRKGSGITGEAGLAGKIGSTVPGSSLEETMKGIGGIKGIHHVEFTRWNYDAIIEGKADFTLVDEPSTINVLPLYPELEIGFTLPRVDYYAFAVSPGSDLVDSLNRFIVEVKKTGRYGEILKRHGLK